MGGRGSSSASKSSAISERYKRNFQKHNDMPVATKKSKSGQFNDYRYAGLDWWKNNQSKSSSYLEMNRVSHDGNKIVVHVGDSMIRETKYGVSLQLDANTVVYLKQWQVSGHTTPYKGRFGYEVVLDKKYFTPKKTKYENPDFFATNDTETYSFDYWKKLAHDQERVGNYVSIRA